jgi:outer membrane protein assembly factor BamB
MRVKSLMCLLLAALPAYAENWPRWRGPDGNPSSSEVLLPIAWDSVKNVRWKVPVPGEGMSSPIVWDDYVFITSADQKGAHRYLHGLSRKTGKTLWTLTVDCENPEHTTAAIGHAATTPATDGVRVVAFFGNAGVACCDLNGNRLWGKRIGDFDVDNGVTTSPIIHGNLVILVCDMRGPKPNSVESFVIALDKKTGDVVWKTERTGLYRSATTPIIIPAPDIKREVVVAAQNEVRSYDVTTGKQLWQVENTGDWMSPSPVYGFDTVFVAGKGAPMLTIKTDGKERPRIGWKEPIDSPLSLPDLKAKLKKQQGSLELFKKNLELEEFRKSLEKTDAQIVEFQKKEAESINALKNQIESVEKGEKRPAHKGFASPLLARNLLCVQSEDGLVACYEAISMTPLFMQRLEGKFTAPAVAGNGMLYLSNTAGATFVLKADIKPELLQVNSINEPIAVAPAISQGCLFFRTDKNLWCIERGVDPLK